MLESCNGRLNVKDILAKKKQMANDRQKKKLYKKKRKTCQYYVMAV